MSLYKVKALLALIGILVITGIGISYIILVIKDSHISLVDNHKKAKKILLSIEFTLLISYIVYLAYIFTH